METVEPLRESLVNHVCSRHLLHAFMNHSGSRTTILCCCKPFNEQLRKEIELVMGADYVQNNLRFIIGSVDYIGR